VCQRSRDCAAAASRRANSVHIQSRAPLEDAADAAAIAIHHVEVVPTKLQGICITLVRAALPVIQFVQNMLAKLNALDAIRLIVHLRETRKAVT